MLIALAPGFSVQRRTSGPSMKSPSQVKQRLERAFTWRHPLDKASNPCVRYDSQENFLYWGILKNTHPLV